MKNNLLQMFVGEIFPEDVLNQWPHVVDANDLVAVVLHAHDL